jgi:type IV secretion system protein VirD4
VLPPQAAGDWQESIVARTSTDDPDNAGIRREPELPEHEEIAPEPRRPAQEFELPEDEPDDDAQRLRALQRQVRTIARQATLDPGDDMGL